MGNIYRREKSGDEDEKSRRDFLDFGNISHLIIPIPAMISFNVVYLFMRDQYAPTYIISPSPLFPQAANHIIRNSDANG